MRLILFILIAAAIGSCNNNPDHDRPECPNCTYEVARDWALDSCRDAQGNPTTPCDTARANEFREGCCALK